MLKQEGFAGVFAGARPGLGDDLARARAVISRFGTDAAYPEVFACLYGDAAAEQLGYRPLNLPARAGFEVAVADALEQHVDPVAALLGLGPRRVEHATNTHERAPAQHRRRGE